jgi:MoxR-like ATPase
LNNSKFFNKVKSTLNIQADEKLLIGKLSHGKDNPNLGYIDVYFEVIDGIVTKLIPDDFTNLENSKKSQVFVIGGYENFEKDYGNDKLFLFRAQINTLSSDRGFCKYKCVYSDAGLKHHLKLSKDCPFIAEISQTEFKQQTIANIQSSYQIERIDSDFQDSPYFFQIDLSAKKLLGPLIVSENHKSTFHGPRNETTFEYWNSRTLSDFQTFLFTFEDYESHITELNINGVNRRFLINLDSFYLNSNGKPRNQDFTLIDLIPDNCLVNEFYNATDKVANIKPFQKSKVKEWLDNKGIRLDKQRKTRLSSLLNSYEHEQEVIDNIYKNILDSEQAETKLRQFANDDEAKYLARYRDKENAQIEQIKNEIQLQKSQIEQQNDAVKNELSKTQKDLVSLNKEKSDLQHHINVELKTALKNVEKSEEYQNMLNDSNMALSEINKKVEEATKIYGHYVPLETLNKKLQKLEETVVYKTQRERELSDTIELLNETARNSSSTLAKAYIDQQIISDIQNHDHYKYFQDKPAQTIKGLESFGCMAESQSEYSTDDCNSNRKAVVTCITDRLIGMNRSIKQDKVEAALIAIMQNQFVVLIGVPGSGKTSFAMQLGCALGASKSTLTIPVAKDWTRPKDLMGYYNPITNVYESGVTNFYPFYKSLNEIDEDASTNSFLILDEFNLSQPEFYMSNLTGFADNSGSREVSLGHNINIFIPLCNRFICTANTDETVQSLSARMISRCAFIQFNELPDLDQTVIDLSFPDDLSPLLTGTDMMKLFKASESDVISGSLKSDIDKLISSFREPSDKYGNGISVTPRKYNQLLQFCKVMSIQEHGQATVLDYASTFFLLPLIAGMGSLFKDRLKNIKSIGEDLSLEEFVKNVDTILLEGDANFEHYHFIMG